ncbi:MAG: protein kinase [Rhodopseudomonas sp.]|nr:protein kinase [Rhodopseudomonas sp.]
MLEPGAKIMQYRIVEVLGAGGFGITYLAEDEMLGKRFAIKEYFPEQFALRKGVSVHARSDKVDDFTWGMQRFLEEARSLARFNHANIVGVSQIFEANNTAYIVLEYQVGRSLKAWLAENSGSPSQEQLDGIVAPLLDALELIHRNDMLHRDLAPDNIYIREDGSPVILDFGSAREAIAARSKTISAIVKSGYSPAEQYSTRGSGQGPWSDVYALAATLYLCVTGKTPEEATERLIADEIVPAAEVAQGRYRKTFLDAIDWGLRLIPKNRPQSIAEWRAALLQDGGVPAIGDNPTTVPASLTASPVVVAPARAAMTARRKRQLAALAAVFVAAIALGLHQFRDRIGGPTTVTAERPAVSTATLDNAPPATPASTSQAGSPSDPTARPSAQPAPPSPSTEPVKVERDAQTAAYQAALQLIKALPTVELCQKSLDGEQWSTAPLMSHHVEEAQRRGLTPGACKRAIAAADAAAAARALLVKKLCQLALNSAANDWDGNVATEAYVVEAKRRGLSVADCREVTVVAVAPPPSSPSPAEPSPPPPDAGPAAEPTVPAPPPGSGTIVLNMDKPLAQAFNWTIGYNQSLRGCIASVTFQDQTTMWAGYTGASDTPFIAASNPKWESIQVGGYYNLVIDLGNDIKVPTTFGGVRAFNGNGVYRGDLSRSFLESFAVAEQLGLYLNGQPMTVLSLAHFTDAKEKLNACREASRRGIKY